MARKSKGIPNLVTFNGLTNRSRVSIKTPRGLMYGTVVYVLRSSIHEPDQFQWVVVNVDLGTTYGGGEIAGGDDHYQAGDLAPTAVVFHAATL